MNVREIFGENLKHFRKLRKLTQEELDETVLYCTHDVEQTIEIFLQRKEEFDGRLYQKVLQWNLIFLRSVVKLGNFFLLC